MNENNYDDNSQEFCGTIFQGIAKINNKYLSEQSLSQDRVLQNAKHPINYAKIRKELDENDDYMPNQVMNMDYTDIQENLFGNNDNFQDGYIREDPQPELVKQTQIQSLEKSQQSYKVESSETQCEVDGANYQQKSYDNEYNNNNQNNNNEDHNNNLVGYNMEGQAQGFDQFFTPYVGPINNNNNNIPNIEQQISYNNNQQYSSSQTQIQANQPQNYQQYKDFQQYTNDFQLQQQSQQQQQIPQQASFIQLPQLTTQQQIPQQQIFNNYTSNYSCYNNYPINYEANAQQQQQQQFQYAATEQDQQQQQYQQQHYNCQQQLQQQQPAEDQIQYQDEYLNNQNADAEANNNIGIYIQQQQSMVTAEIEDSSNNNNNNNNVASKQQQFQIKNEYQDRQLTQQEQLKIKIEQQSQQSVKSTEIPRVQVKQVVQSQQEFMETWKLGSNPIDQTEKSLQILEKKFLKIQQTDLSQEAEKKIQLLQRKKSTNKDEEKAQRFRNMKKLIMNGILKYFSLDILSQFSHINDHITQRICEIAEIIKQTGKSDTSKGKKMDLFSQPHFNALFLTLNKQSCKKMVNNKMNIQLHQQIYGIDITKFEDLSLDGIEYVNILKDFMYFIARHFLQKQINEAEQKKIQQQQTQQSGDDKKDTIKTYKQIVLVSLEKMIQGNYINKFQSYKNIEGQFN